MVINKKSGKISEEKLKFDFQMILLILLKNKKRGLENFVNIFVYQNIFDVLLFTINYNLTYNYGFFFIKKKYFQNVYIIII